MNQSFLIQRARQFGGWLILLSALGIISSLVSLTIPWLASRWLGVVVEADANAQATVPGLEIALIVVLALSILALLTVVTQALASLIAGRLLASLRREAYHHIQRLPLAFHDRARHGNIHALLTSEVNSLGGFLTNTLAGLPSTLITTLGALVLLVMLDPLLALLAPAAIGFFFIVQKVIGRRLRALARKTQRAFASFAEAAERDLELFPAIKAFAREAEFEQGYAHRVEELRRLSFQQSRIGAMLGPLFAWLGAMLAIGLIVVISANPQGEPKPATDLFALLFYAALLTRPIARLGNLYGEVQVAKGTLARLARVLEMAPEPGYAASQKLSCANGAIHYEAVSFSYPGRAALLDQVTFAIAPGEIVALTGENGAGKSSILALLLGFYEPRGGRVLLDGTDISKFQVQDLRRQIGYVPQRALLFNGSVRANIAFGVEHPDEAALERALVLSHATRFVSELPNGLDTEIGDHGVRLSGGQRQRLALARALYQDPPILIFDEATAMWDIEAEAAFVETCTQALAGRTVILVTHRPASLALAHRVLHLASGKVIEVALHETSRTC